MNFIEFNISVGEIEFSIFKKIKNKKIYIVKNKLIIPKSFDIGNRLNYIKKVVSSIIKEYDVNKSYINKNELENEDNIQLIKIEGIVEELLFNCGVEICK